ncbi:HNH endonuclease [Acinetobacter pittii]|uniref:HNH endonuclease n=1 Tax=Acinetobacter pittii TaxID=48296 RepID=UPI002DBAAD5B|nr:HNH endonuclease [Acinetobacter pittii]MEB7642755.1 HNH endonuclease [Acinetobacter pittii]
MKNIPVYKKGDEFIFIPISDKKRSGGARAFLPCNENYKYKVGYKAEPIIKDDYFDAIAFIQDNYNRDDRKLFLTNNGKKKENQKSYKWRHGINQLTPFNWIKLPVAELYNVNNQMLIELVDDIEKGGVGEYISLMEMAPVICETEEELALKTEILKKTLGNKLPKGLKVPKKISKSSIIYYRDAAVRAYILLNANGVCELCDKEAPFRDESGNPYLEVHHVLPLSCNGSDTITNTVALCPNCHKSIHFSNEKIKLYENLFKKNQRLIREQML